MAAESPYRYWRYFANSKMTQMAHSGHALVRCKCPLLGVKQTWLFAPQMSANDPKASSSVWENGRSYQRWAEHV